MLDIRFMLLRHRPCLRSFVGRDFLVAVIGGRAQARRARHLGDIDCRTAAGCCHGKSWRWCLRRPDSFRGERRRRSRPTASAAIAGLSGMASMSAAALAERPGLGGHRITSRRSAGVTNPRAADRDRIHIRVLVHMVTAPVIVARDETVRAPILIDAAMRRGRMRSILFLPGVIAVSRRMQRPMRLLIGHEASIGNAFISHLTIVTARLAIHGHPSNTRHDRGGFFAIQRGFAPIPRGRLDLGDRSLPSGRP